MGMTNEQFFAYVEETLEHIKEGRNEVKMQSEDVKTEKLDKIISRMENRLKKS